MGEGRYPRDGGSPPRGGVLLRTLAGMPVPFVATPSWLPDVPAEAVAPPERSRRAGGAHPAGASPDGAFRAPDSPHSAHAAAPDGIAPVPRALELELLGELAPFASAPDVTDLFVNGERGLWIDRGAGAVHEPAWVADEAGVRALAIRLVARGGRHLDEASPAVDVRLGSGIRVHTVLRELHSLRWAPACSVSREWRASQVAPAATRELGTGQRWPSRIGCVHERAVERTRG